MKSRMMQGFFLVAPSLDLAPRANVPFADRYNLIDTNELSTKRV